MAITFIKAADAATLARALNGGVIGKRDLTLRGRDQTPNPAVAPNDLYKHPVAGLTLIFTAPAVTVTFSADLNWRQIVAEINAAAPSIGHLWKNDANGGSVLALWDDTTPVVMLNTGTANSYFGFSTTVSDPDLTQTAVDSIDIIQILVEPLSRQYVAFING